VEPTISIANSSHVAVLNNYLQEENICLLSEHVGPSMRMQNFVAQVILIRQYQSMQGLNTAVGSSVGQCQMVAHFDST
jgi:hypothetical protein